MYTPPPGGGYPPPVPMGQIRPQINSHANPPAYVAPLYKAQNVAQGHFYQPPPPPPLRPVINSSAPMPDLRATPVSYDPRVLLEGVPQVRTLDRPQVRPAVDAPGYIITQEQPCFDPRAMPSHPRL